MSLLLALVGGTPAPPDLDPVVNELLRLRRKRRVDTETPAPAPTAKENDEALLIVLLL